MSEHNGVSPRTAEGALSRRTFTVGVVLGAAGLGIEACRPSAGDTGAGSAAALRVGESAGPTSIDPTKGGGESKAFFEPAYDPLIYMAADGTLQPRLATSWRYVGDRNEEFQITLRKGVVFSDGTPLDAAAVKANIEYAGKAGTQVSPFLAAISSVHADDDLTVRLKLSEPHPLLPVLFSQEYFAGDMISPKAIAKPARLAGTTFGAGKYVLDPRATIAGDHYTYAKNTRYWNPRGIAYDKVVIKVLPNENTALAALKTGQVDAVHGSFAIAGGAKSAGMRIAASPSIVMGIQLNDRDGKLSAPLKDVRVRRALNFAVDRPKLAKAVFGSYGVPTEQPVAPGQDGYNATAVYRYDPAEARRLLAAAGYPRGFRLPVVISTDNPYGKNLLQAMAAQFAQIGVTVTISTKVQSQFFPSLERYPASIMGWGVAPIYLIGRNLWLRDAVGMNPFHSSDATLEGLDRRAAAADETTRAGLDRQIVRRVVDLAWFVPVVLSPQFLFTRPSVEAGARSGQHLPPVTAWRPAA
ncbi:MAG TPA: ABC transporter substrate-binding protein [Streptosporangiaceae bacterium]